MTMDRRRFLALGGASLAALMLDGCNSQGPEGARDVLRWAERKNEGVERFLFRHTRMDDPAAPRNVGRAMPAYFISERVPSWDPAVRGAWTLEVTGAVARPLRLTLDQLTRLPSVTQRVNHYCVEGWTATTEFTGVRVSTLARLAGRNLDGG